MSQCSFTVNDFHRADSSHHINHIRFTPMPDCHMQSDSSTFHTVNPGGEKIERQKEGETVGPERKRTLRGKMERREDSLGRGWRSEI